MKKSRSTRFLFINFFLISAVIIGVISFLTFGPKTWDALHQIYFKYIIFSFLLGFMANCFDTLRIQILTQAFGYYFPFKEGLKAIFAYNFLANITPSALGGEPVLIYMLTDTTGMDTQKATTIAIVRGIFLILIIAIAGPLILLFEREYFEIALMRAFFDYATLIFIIIIGLGIYSYFNLDKVRSVLERIIGFFQKFKLFQKHPSPQIRVKHMEIWIEEFISCFKYLFQKKKASLLYTACFTILSQITNYSIVYILLKGMNHDINFLKVLVIQIILYFVLYVIPTPGGSGFAEGGFYLLFYNYVPKHLLGILVILWRFFIAYLWVIVGWVVILKTLGMKGLEEIKERMSIT
ncbi:MAG: lysylphosphatidylglycerol synthase transmembrane domain-containing protein [bacterium]